jgi:hypothetical protein
MTEKLAPSISRFLFALLRPFMSEPPPPPGLPYLHFHSSHGSPIVMDVVDWNLQMSQSLDDAGDNSYAKCSLHYVEYCKCSHGVDHEFLVFHFGHWNRDSSAVGVVCADCTVITNQDNSSSSGQSSGIVSPSSSDNVARDTVSILGSPRNATSYLTQTYGSFNTLYRLSFASASRPSSLQVSTILSLVNNVSLLYKLFDRQCYWYANTVWRSLKRIFPENEELCYDHNARSRYGPFLLGPSDESVGVVCNRYESAWDITLKQWTQARDRHAAQRAQIIICSKDGLPRLSIVLLAVSRRRP